MRVHCVVNNTARRSSQFWGEHGVAFLVESAEGQVLFDTGQSGDVFLHNARLLDIDLMQVEALALSHAHYDHTGGLAKVLPKMRDDLPLYANPDLFRERFTQKETPEGRVDSIGLPIDPDGLRARLELRFSDTPTEIMPGVWTSGEVQPRPFFEGRSPGHVIQAGDSYLPDPYADDLSLVLEGGEGLVLLCGCCHAGLLNTLAYVDQWFAGDVIAVVGGTHLASATDDDLAQTADMLRERYDSPALYLNHCTGERAYLAMAQAFGEERVQPCPAGESLAF